MLQTKGKESFILDSFIYLPTHLFSYLDQLERATEDILTTAGKEINFVGYVIIARILLFQIAHSTVFLFVTSPIYLY